VPVWFHPINSKRENVSCALYIACICFFFILQMSS
jgi:hypothetical protein